MTFCEDMTPGEGQLGPSGTADGNELVSFAHDWDRMPFHVDEAAGIAVFGSLTAPGLYVLALKQRLIHALPEPHAVSASLGYDEVRFLAPVRPGDSLTLIQEAQPLLDATEELEHRSGAEFWFTPETTAHPRPKPYKQFLVSLSAIYPLILVVPWALQPLFTAVPELAHPLAAKLVPAVIVVLLMVYLIMPRYSRWLGAWLFR